MVEKACKRGRGTHADDVDILCIHNVLHCGIKGFMIDLGSGLSDFFNIRRKYFFKYVILTNEIVGHFHTLERGQTAANELFEFFLQLGIPLITKLVCKAHNSRLGNTNYRAESGCGIVCGFVVMLQNVCRYLSLSSGKGGHAIFYDLKQVTVVHRCSLPFPRCHCNIPFIIPQKGKNVNQKTKKSGNIFSFLYISFIDNIACL